jgi:hypothetical protein
MSADLLSYLVTSSPSEEIAQIGAARDLIAARVIAAEADRGNPDALAFVQGAQESLAQAQIRRARANRLRAGAARASLAGYHTLARMGAEAASEEETGASLLEADVAAAIRGSHAMDGFGYYSESEKRELKRKAYEESLSASQREDVMNKLLSQLYQSSDTLGGDENGDNAAVTAFLDTAASVYAGDLDSVFGADAAERMGAVAGAAVAKIKGQISRLRAKLAVASKPSVKRQIRKKISDLRKKLASIQSGSRAIGRAEDAREQMDAAEASMLDQLTDYGAEGRLAVMVEKLKSLSTERVQAIAKDPFRRKDVRAAARAELARRESGDEESDASEEKTTESKRVRVMRAKLRKMSDKRVQAIAKDPFRRKDVRAAARAELARRESGDGESDASEEKTTESKRVRVMRAKLRKMSDKRVQAIAKDPFRRKDVRAAARAELKRRAGDKDEEDTDTDTESSSESSASNDMVATPPKAFDEEGYLASYKGITPARRRFIQHFKNRAARMGADSPEMLAYALQTEDTFGGFFSALGEFFRNLFSVGARDTKRISDASRAAREARQAKRAELKIKEQRANLAQIRVQRLEARRAQTKDPSAIAALDGQISKARAELRAAREQVRAAGKAAFEQSFDASRPGQVAAPAAPSAPPAFPITGTPILTKDVPRRGSSEEYQKEGELVRLLQTYLFTLGHFRKAATGVFDSDTDKAVRAFQKKHDLEVDGDVGPSTAAVLATVMASTQKAVQ